MGMDPIYPPNKQKKLAQPYQGPFLIIEKLNDVNYRVQQTPNSKKITLHIDHLKEYTELKRPVLYGL